MGLYIGHILRHINSFIKKPFQQFFISNISKIPQSMNWRNYIIKSYKRNYHIPKIVIDGLSD